MRGNKYMTDDCGGTFHPCSLADIFPNMSPLDLELTELLIADEIEQTGECG
jgi:hypothetical protein